MTVTSVLITGANRGIGLEFVKQYLAQASPPKHIIATARQPDAATDLQNIAKSAPGLHVLPLEVGNYNSYTQFVSSVGEIVGEEGLNVLINNAGILRTGNLDEVTHEKMRENFEINSIAPLMLTKALLPLIKIAAARKTPASIINVSSKVGSIDDNSSGGNIPYRTSKVVYKYL